MRNLAFFSSLRAHSKVYFQVIFGLVCVGLGIYFIRHERGELSSVADSLVSADIWWVMTGVVLVIVFVLVQGLMYQCSFMALNRHIGLGTGVLLFLKRNLVSVFLPAGMLTNVAFFNREVEERDGVGRPETYLASIIFSLCSLFTGIVIGIPAALWLLLRRGLTGSLSVGIVATSLILALLVWAVVDLIKQGPLFRWLGIRWPGITNYLSALEDARVDHRYIWRVTGLSVIVEIIGIAHLYIATAALGGAPTLELAIVGYGIVVLILMSSPFLRGIGTIEVALTFALGKFGFSTVLSLSIAFLFRFFEFWSVLLIGLLAFVARPRAIVYRIWPSVLLLLLGAIDIWSALTPALPARLRTLQQFLPPAAISTSAWIVLVIGLLSLVLSYYLFRGYRLAWWAALVVSFVSLVGHFTKGIDWEEASLAAVTIGSLVVARKDYFIPSRLAHLRSFFKSEVTGGADVDRVRVAGLIRDYGNSSMDYFKTYRDKQFWIDPGGRGAVAYQRAHGFAIVLEGPVGVDNPTRQQLMVKFDAYAHQNGWRTAYYRLPETACGEFRAAGKLLMPIGEEATVDLTTWTLEGKQSKVLRNAINKLTRAGFTFLAATPPHSPAYLQQLREVSDAWLADMQRVELGFSQGVFSLDELRTQTILSVVNAEDDPVAFVNLIPSGVPGEGNFDLMRKTADAPNGTMDFLFCQVFDYLKDAGFSYCNLGMVPMSGIDAPANLEERAMKLAYERITTFSHYRGLRSFKEKFRPSWQMMYLAYATPLDLVQLPLALEAITHQVGASTDRRIG